MKLMSHLSPEISALLGDTPLGYMLRVVEQSPVIGWVYADDEATPQTCVLRIGALLFVGGKVSQDCLAYIKNKVLTQEIRKRHRVFYFFFPDERWRDSLMELFSGNGRIYERTLLYTDSLPDRTTASRPEVVPITKELMVSDAKNLKMITGEVTTYASFNHFLCDGIGYTLLMNNEVNGFCTSEYQSKHELAIGIEVTKAYQKQGYAKAMTAAFLSKAIPRGFRVYWESWKNNTASVNTALACGFRKAADYPVVFVDFCKTGLPKQPPEPDLVKTITEKYLNNVMTVERVLNGRSTYVYRVATASGVYYARFLPEEASFAAEVLAHRKLLDVGVIVPKVVAFEHREECTGLSLMLTQEIPGACIGESRSENGLDHILREAGRQLAKIHTISVDGFGWIDRCSYNQLKGEKQTFREYFSDYLGDDLQTLWRYDFSDKERTRIAELMQTAEKMLDTKQAVLVHGDFDVSHIFYADNKFSGLIDFGEIRGNNRLYDLATFSFADNSPDRVAYSHVLEGYCEKTPLTDEDLYAAELFALFQILRFLGKKGTEPSGEYWCKRAKMQFGRIDEFQNGLF